MLYGNLPGIVLEKIRMGSRHEAIGDKKALVVRNQQLKPAADIDSHRLYYRRTAICWRRAGGYGGRGPARSLKEMPLHAPPRIRRISG